MEAHKAADRTGQKRREEALLLNKETAMMSGALTAATTSYQSESSHPHAVAAQIVHLAKRAIRTVGPVEVDRIQWPLFWAVDETGNHLYRYFVLSNPINAHFGAALQAVVCEQSSDGVGGQPGHDRLRDRLECENWAAADHLPSSRHGGMNNV
ncbi:hypothetical protein SEUCBS140593_002751 [Sporothrix eucalyptigena]|uniref:Uncharacterized protein n=1 Tax=Sporothrix eucalyptigena TaxID=1812306 RepID=A0ABP0B944_9PEZI